MLLIAAHIVTIAVPLSKKIANLAAIEANPDTFRLLEMNLMLNQCGNVAAFNCAANDVTGTIDFVMNTVNSGGSKRIPLHADQGYFSDRPEIRTVQASALDELFPNAKFHLIFMDIEGSEYFAMRGMPNLLREASIVVTEFIPHHLARVGGISLDQFLEPLREFEAVAIPSLKQLVARDGVNAALSQMVRLDQADAGLIFIKDGSQLKITF